MKAFRTEALVESPAEAQGAGGKGGGGMGPLPRQQEEPGLPPPEAGPLVLRDPGPRSAER